MPIPIAWSEIYAHPLPEGHRFPMEKYDLLPKQLLHEGTIEPSQLFEPPPLEESIVLRTHDQDYWQKLKSFSLSEKEQRASGFPLSEQLVLREQIICNGTRLGAEMAATKTACAFNIAGGTHHAYANRAEGFCLLNDIAIGAHHLLDTHLAQRILVIDLDVHQGNGTASIFKNDSRVYTFSMHGEKNYPFKKEQSSLDVGLPDKIEDSQYLDILIKNLNQLAGLPLPNFVFYQAGVDILATDKLGKLNISLAGCKERDRLVLEWCEQRGIPMHISMGGGYSAQISHIIEAHANTYRLAKHYFG